MALHLPLNVPPYYKILARTLLLSALPHAGDWLNGILSTTLEWVLTFRTKSFALAYAVGSEWAVGVTETGSPGTMPFEMSSL